MHRFVLGTIILGLVGLALSSEQPAAWAASRSFGLDELPARVLAGHNIERARLGVAPVAWDDNLARGAAAYAAEMARTGRFQHSSREGRARTGENLWMGTRGAYSLEQMVGGWLDERRLFVPGIFPNVSRSGNWADVGHYTQMVARRTTRIGCAVGSSRSYDYLVCRYSPSGNVDGRMVF